MISGRDRKYGITGALVMGERSEFWPCGWNARVGLDSSFKLSLHRECECSITEKRT